MKQTLLILMLLVSCMMYAQKPIKIQGTIDDQSVTKLYIFVGDTNEYGKYLPVQTIDVKKGKFTYSTSLSKIVKATLQTTDNEEAENACTLILVPGETMKLTIKGKEYFYDGSKIYKEMDAADHAITPLKSDLYNYYNAVLQRVSTMTDEQAAAQGPGIQDTLNTKAMTYNNAITEYISTHANEEGALLYLADDIDVDSVLNASNDNIKNGRVGTYLKDIIAHNKKIQEEQEKQAAEEQAKMDAMSGTPAKDFTLNDINGKPLSLSSLRGKYVVLDFWGSWCGWCIKGMPDMKKYYEKYAGKFEILGIDNNDSEEAWKNAVKKYELPWLHVYNPKGSTLLADYAIQGFPTKIVIDPQGNINKIIVGEDPAFYTYLDEILSK